MSGCPDKAQLSAFGDDALEAADHERVVRHLGRCQRCRGVVDTQTALGDVFARALCPDPEVLAKFIDDALDGERLERVAAHVLRCEDCAEVVSWTREGQQQIQSKTGRGTGRRRRPQVRRRADGFPAWVGVAAAAAILVVGGLIFLRSPSVEDEGPVAEGPDTPETTPDTTPDTTTDVDTPDTTPDTTTDVGTPDTTPDTTTDVGTPDTTPDTIPDVDTPDTTPDTIPDVDTPDTTPDTDTPDSTSDTQEREAAPVAVVALAQADLTWSAGEKPRALRGRVEIPVGSEVAGQRRGGTIQVGDARCQLTNKGAVRVGDGSLAMVRGEALFDAGAAALRVDCGEARVEAQPGGRFLIDRNAEHSFMVCVVDGGVRVSAPGQAAETLRPGEGRRFDRGTPSDVRGLAARLKRARELAKLADGVAGIDALAGMRVLRGLESCRQQLGGAEESRARGSLGVEASRLLPGAMGELAARQGDLIAQSDASLDALLAEQERFSAGVLTELALAVACRSLRTERRPSAETRATLEAMAKRLTRVAPVDPGVSDQARIEMRAKGLATQAHTLFALRACETLAKPKLRAVWKAVGAELASPSDVWEIDRALLAKVRVDPRRALAAVDARLADPAALPGAKLDALQRIAILTGGLTPERRRALEARALHPGVAGGLNGLFWSQAAARLLGRKVALRAESHVLAVPTAGGYRVSFSFSPDNGRARAAYLVGSWAGWVPDAIPMTRGVDGAWRVTVELPAGHHEYKLRTVPDDAWVTDPLNPRIVTDEQGRENSPLDLVDPS